MIFLSDPLCQSVSLLAWQSRKVKRIVNSTLAAEALQMVDAAGKAYWLRCLLEEIIPTKIHVPIHCITDSKILCDAVHSTKQVLDNRLRIDLAMLKEMVHNKEVNKVTWVPKDQQIADCLTKRGEAAVYFYKQ